MPRKRLRVSNTEAFKVVLHDEGREVTRGYLDHIHPSKPTDSWQPIEHAKFVSNIESCLMLMVKLNIGDQFHSVSHVDKRYFGILELFGSVEIRDISWIVGIINSNDRTAPARLVAGMRIEADNTIAFSGEIDLATRHTENVLDRLMPLIKESVHKLYNSWSIQDLRVDAYKKVKLSNEQAYTLIIEALDGEVICSRDIPYVIKAWRQRERTKDAWGMFCSIVLRFQELKVPTLIAATIKLFQFFDAKCKVVAHHASPYVQETFV